MAVRTRALRVGAPLLILATALVVASCSSSTNSTPATPSPTTSATIPTGGGTITAASVSGYTPAFVIGAGASANTTLTSTTSTTPPANAPLPSSHARTVRSLTGANPFLWVSFTVSQTTPTNIFTGETLTLPSTPIGVNYYVEFDDITTAPATKLASFGPASVSSSVATFTNNGTGSGGGTSTLVAGHTYLVMFYTLPVSGPSPTPSPTSTAGATPTPTPSGSSPTPTPTSSSSSTPQTAYTFGGSPLAQSTFTPNGGSISTSDSTDGITSFQETWSTNNGPSTYTFNLSLAQKYSEITPAGFTAFNVTGYTLVTYFKNSASPSTAVTFTYTPQASMTVTSAAMWGGTKCGIFSLNGNGNSTPTWQEPSFIPETAPSGTTLTINSATFPANNGQVGNDANGNAAYLAIACH